MHTSHLIIFEFASSPPAGRIRFFCGWYVFPASGSHQILSRLVRRPASGAHQVVSWLSHRPRQRGASDSFVVGTFSPPAGRIRFFHGWCVVPPAGLIRFYRGCRIVPASGAHQILSWLVRFPRQRGASDSFAVGTLIQVVVSIGCGFHLNDNFNPGFCFPFGRPF